MFSWNLWNIISRRIIQSGKFQTFPGKVWIEAKPMKLKNFEFVFWLKETPCQISVFYVFTVAHRDFPGQKFLVPGLFWSFKPLY